MNPYLQHKRLLQREYSRRHYERLKAKGLTCRGTPRKYTLHPEITGVHGKNRVIALNRLYRKRFTDQGLTTRGTFPRKGPSLLERAWRQLRATMVLQPPGWWDAA